VDDIRLALSDVVLPDESGIDVVDHIRRVRPDLKVLLMSGYTDVGSHWPAIQDRGLAFLQKPFGMRRLLNTVREILDQPAK